MAMLLVSLLATTSVKAVTAPVITSAAPSQVKTHIETIDEKIERYANQYGVNLLLMKSVVWCESRNNPNAIGDSGHSRGLVQIYDTYHPTITNEQAFDPDFSLEFLASNIAQDRGYLWTCYRTITNTP